MSYCTECGCKKDSEDKYCPNCGGQQKTSLMDKIMRLGDWLTEPIPLTPEAAIALAELRRSEAELIRAKNKTAEAESHLHQHIHIYDLDNEKKKLMQREVKPLKEHDED